LIISKARNRAPAQGSASAEPKLAEAPYLLEVELHFHLDHALAEFDGSVTEYGVRLLPVCAEIQVQRVRTQAGAGETPNRMIQEIVSLEAEL
jgi:hypothetical protein